MKQQLFARRPSMIIRRGGVLSGEIPGILNICAFMQLASRNAYAGRQVVPGTALLPLPFLPSSEKETIGDFPCLDGSALHGNAANIAARLAAAKTLQIG